MSLSFIQVDVQCDFDTVVFIVYRQFVLRICVVT